jgi:hypothetical protein
MEAPSDVPAPVVVPKNGVKVAVCDPVTAVVTMPQAVTLYAWPALTVLPGRAVRLAASQSAVIAVPPVTVV